MGQYRIFSKALRFWLLRVVNAFRGPSKWRTLLQLLVFSLPLLLYAYVVSVHRLSNLREIVAALRTMSLPVVEGHPRCRHYNATHFKCLPDTFLIGASKCGTTSLVEYLSALPGVALVGRRVTVRDHHREVHRFDRPAFRHAWGWLERADEWASAPVVADPRTTVLHYTPHYLYAPTVPFDLHRFYASLPQQQQGSAHSQLRFIVLLRDPTARALSSYWFSNSHLFRGSGGAGKEAAEDGGSMADFERLFVEEEQRRQAFDTCMRGHAYSPIATKAQTLPLEAVLAALEACFGTELRSGRLGGRHFDKGIYVDQLYRWFRAFPPAEETSGSSGGTSSARYFVSSLEHMQQQPDELLSALRQFLLSGENRRKEGANPGAATRAAEGNRQQGGGLGNLLARPNSLASLPEHAPSAALLARVRAFYAPYALLLGELLERRLGKRLGGAVGYIAM